MKRFIDKKYTVNIALAIVAVFGIIIGIVTASIGSEMAHTSAEQLALSKGGNGCSMPASFGADFYTYVFDAANKAAYNTDSTADGVQIVNSNLQLIADAQCKVIQSIGKCVNCFGLFMIALFAAIGCSGIRINPCYVENANDAEVKIEKAEDESE